MLYWKLPGRSGDACRALKCENKFMEREKVVWSIQRTFCTFYREQKDGEQIYFSVSRDGLHWKDLVSWKGPKAHTIGVEGAGCVWAPEAIYDESEDAILVF